MNRNTRRRGPFVSKNIRMSEPYLLSEYVCVLKGLLKPFKGKGDFDLWCAQLRELAMEMRTVMQRRAREGFLYGHDALPLRLVLQRSQDARRRYLRWRSNANDKMGFSVLASAVHDSTLTQNAKNDLMEQEAERIVVNMQLTSILALTECAERAYEEFNRLEALRQSLGDSSHSL